MNLPTLVANRHTCAGCDHAPKPGTARGRALCDVEGGVITELQELGECPLGLFPPPLPDGAPIPDPKPQTPCEKKAAAVWGPPLWTEFHRAAGAGTITPDWLVAFVARIPCPECRTDFAKAVAADPPPAAELQPEWSYRHHDRVRRKLDQPVMSFEDAAALWGWPVINVHEPA